MKKFFVIISLILLLFSTNLVHATPVQIYDYSVENIISNLKKECAQQGIDIWGTEYYTYKGTQRCELHFGNTKSNVIRFRLNNDKSVSRILVTIPNPFIKSDGSKNSFMQTAFITSLPLLLIMPLRLMTNYPKEEIKVPSLPKSGLAEPLNFD